MREPRLTPWTAALAGAGVALAAAGLARLAFHGLEPWSLLATGGTLAIAAVVVGVSRKGSASSGSAAPLELLQDVEAVVWEADAESLEFTFVSRAADGILARPDGGWLSQAWGWHMHADDRPWALAVCRGDVAQGNDFCIEYRAVKPGGDVVWVRDTVRVVRGAGGRPTGLRGVMVDISERKVVEDIMEENQQRLELLHRISTSCAGLSSQEIARAAVRELAEQVHGARAAYGVLDGEGRVTILHSAGPEVMPDIAGKVLDARHAAEYLDHLRDDRPVIVTAASTDHRVAGAEPWQAAGAAATVHVPVRLPGGDLGVLILDSDAPHEWTEHDIATLRETADLLRTLFRQAHADEERQASRRALQESQAVLYDLFENSNDLILQISPSGRFLQVNRACREALGWSVNELREMEFERVLHPSGRTKVLEALRRAAEGTPVKGLEAVFLSKDGRAIAVEGNLTARLEDGRPQFLRAIFRDATERRIAEATLRRSEEHFRTLIENAHDMITVVGDNGLIRYRSPAVTKLLGIPPEEMVGRPVLDWVHPDDVEAVNAALARSRAEPGVPHRAEFRLRRRDNTWRHCEGIGTAVTDEHGDRRVIVNTRDVTDRRVAEEALRASEEQLRHAQKMEAVGRLAGGVAHDFNNLLTVVLSYSELLLDSLDEGSSSRKGLEEIRKAAERASALTQSLLAFGRRQVVEMKALQLNSIVADMRDMLRRLIGEDFVLETQLDAELGLVRADRGQIETMLMNLVVNARDAMPSGGKLTIRTDGVTIPAAGGGAGVPPGAWAVLSVRDTGIGMSEDVRARLFEPFFTTKPKGKGTGLGLSTAWGIVRQAGGHILVESEPSKGTVFRVYLPRDSKSDRHTTPRPGTLPATGPPRGTETLLLVEDEDPVRELAKTVLEGSGYRVLPAANGEEALQLAGSFPERIHAMVTDVVMPGMSGLELARRLAPLRPDTRVLYVSGYTDNAIALDGQLEPGTSFLQKPFTPLALAVKVRGVLDG